MSSTDQNQLKDKVPLLIRPVIWLFTLCIQDQERGVNRVWMHVSKINLPLYALERGKHENNYLTVETVACRHIAHTHKQSFNRSCLHLRLLGHFMHFTDRMKNEYIYILQRQIYVTKCKWNVHNQSDRSPTHQDARSDRAHTQKSRTPAHRDWLQLCSALAASFF